jgi:hypothetical protein
MPAEQRDPGPGHQGPGQVEQPAGLDQGHRERAQERDRDDHPERHRAHREGGEQVQARDGHAEQRDRGPGLFRPRPQAGPHHHGQHESRDRDAQQHHPGRPEIVEQGAPDRRPELDRHHRRQHQQQGRTRHGPDGSD